MSVLPRRVLPYLGLLLAAGLVAALAWRQLQGPVVPVIVAEQRSLVQQVVASGEVRSDSLVRIGSEITGVVKARAVCEGDHVLAGDLLLELHDAEQQARVQEAAAALEQLVGTRQPQAAAALREAEQMLTQADAELERREVLAARGQLADEQAGMARTTAAGARAAFEQATLQLQSLAASGPEEQQAQQRLEAAKAALARTRITAPVTGTVQTRGVEPGDVVQLGVMLLELAREQSLKIVVPVDEKNMGGLAPGQPASVIADAFPERVVAARISFLAPTVDPARGTLAVDLELLEAADFLRHGMTVSASIETGRRDSALLLPNDALFDLDGDVALVQFVRDGRVVETAVTLGLRGAVASEIVAGLEPGAQVLVNRLEPGQRVRVQLAAAQSATGN
jgi:HlyD family secretion protein